MDKTLEQRIEELEKKIADLEKQVPEQPKNETPEQIIKKQISFLQSVQEECVDRGVFDCIAPISAEIYKFFILFRDAVDCK